MADLDLSRDEQARLDELYELAQAGTYYELLGVEADADPRAVQKAYYELSRAWHPDRFFRKNLGSYTERLEFVFTTMTRAYRTLADPANRSRYNRELQDRGVKLPPPPPTTPPPPSTTPPPHGYEVRPPPRAAPKATTTTTPPPPKKVESRVVQQIREQVRERQERAKAYYETGKADLEAGRAVKAATVLALAVQLDPRNEVYQRLLDEAKGKSKINQLETLLKQAKEYDDKMNPAAALHHIKLALEYDPPDATLWYRVAVATRDQEKDARKAVNFLRKAVEKAPDNLDYRLALADLYMELKLELNARREYQAVLERDKKNEKARKVLKAMGVLMF